MDKQLPYADKASQKMKEYASKKNMETVWDRFDSLQPQCKIGQMGTCCRICSMGPCQIKPSEKTPKSGVCGANSDTIAARNLARMIASGASAHSDHGREIAITLLEAATNAQSDFQIKDEEKLKTIADIYNIRTQGLEIKDIAKKVARATLQDFGQTDGYIKTIKVAPVSRLKRWKELKLLPRSIDREVVELLHRTTMGVDMDYKNIIKQGMRTVIADGWGGSLIATELSDILFGTPYPQPSIVNLGVLKKDEVNVIVHGHEPTLSDVIATVSNDKTLIKKAKDRGAKGINIAGICCTANEILMRHGIPTAGNFLQQELAIMTGAVDLMVVDIQCVMFSLNKIANCFHTKLVTTSSKSRIPGIKHIEFQRENAIRTAYKILEIAIENFPNRNMKKVMIPKHTEQLVTGYSSESIIQILEEKFPLTTPVINEAIISGKLRGLAAIVGCSNPKIDFEKGHTEIAKKLIKNDTLVVSTGCSAISCAKKGLLKINNSLKYAGNGLTGICKALGIPPILHMGSCVNNSRILLLLTHILNGGGLGKDLSDMPVAGAAPEWMSEKAVSIGFYFVASGIYTVFGHPLPIMGSSNLLKYVTEEIEADVGGKFDFETDPIKAAYKMLNHIDKKRKALKLSSIGVA